MDRRHGIICRAKVTGAAAHDGARLREGLIDPDNTVSDVWAGDRRSAKDQSACRPAEKERSLTRIGKVSRIHGRKPQGRPMPRRTARGNAKRSAVLRPCRASLRPPEGADGAGDPHHRHRARHATVVLANMASTMRRWCWLDRRSLPA